MIDHWEIEVKSNGVLTKKTIEILEKCGATVKKNDSVVSFTHTDLLPTMSHEEALIFSKKLINSMNFVLQRLHGQPIDLLFSDIVGFTPNGGKYLYVNITENIKVSCSFETNALNSKGEVIPEPELPTARWKDLLLQNPDVSIVCELLSCKPNKWNDLYKVLEIIAKNIGGLEKIHKLEWATEASIKRFKHTANSPFSIGRNARHGVDKGKPPKPPMIHTEAIALIDTIVYQWILSKI